MNNTPIIRKLAPSEHGVIEKIAQWYHNEWSTPIDKTFDRFQHQTENKILFQLLLSKGDEILATGGLGHHVYVLDVYPFLKKWGPWVAMLYTDPSYRGQGCGSMLMDAIEQQALEMGIQELYLHTYSAQSLYEKRGYQVIEEVDYRDHLTVIMKKELS